MNCLHKFAPFPETMILFCERCGASREVGAVVASAAPEVRSSAPPSRSADAERSRPDAVAQAQADEVTLPIEEVNDPELDALLEGMQTLRERAGIEGGIDNELLGAHVQV